MLFYGCTLTTGASLLGLHRYMMEHCFDAKGLLISGNLPGILQMAAGGALAVFLVLLSRTLGGDGTYEDNFPQDVFSGVVMLAAGVVMALAVPGIKAAQPEPGVQKVMAAVIMEGVGKAVPWLAAGSMAVLGICRILGRRPNPLFGGVVCLLYMMMLVDNYRLWSADPQLHNYAYQLLAGVLLMLCAFHRTCCDAGIIQRKKLILTGLAAAACCMGAMSMGFQRTFYLASALWGAGCICDMAVLPPDEIPAENEE